MAGRLRVLYGCGVAGAAVLDYSPAAGEFSAESRLGCSAGDRGIVSCYLCSFSFVFFSCW